MIKLMELQSQNYQIESQNGHPPSSFVRGMSLEQYMSKKVMSYNETSQDQNDTYENLYESSGNQQVPSSNPKNIDYCINQIDQESVEDSNQSIIQESLHMRQEQMPRKAAGFKTPLPQGDWKSHIGGIAMNATAYFKNEKEDRNSFRVKRVSMSPSKKFDKTMANGSITIYGNKFGQAVQRKTVNMPEIVTFYGKLNIEPHKNNDFTSSKDKFKKKEMKANVRKNQLNLNQLLECQSRIKKNRASHSHLEQLKISNKISRVNQKINQNY